MWAEKTKPICSTEQMEAILHRKDKRAKKRHIIWRQIQTPHIKRL